VEYGIVLTFQDGGVLRDSDIVINTDTNTEIAKHQRIILTEDITR